MTRYFALLTAALTLLACGNEYGPATVMIHGNGQVDCPRADNYDSSSMEVRCEWFCAALPVIGNSDAPEYNHLHIVIVVEKTGPVSDWRRRYVTQEPGCK